MGPNFKKKNVYSIRRGETNKCLIQFELLYYAWERPQLWDGSCSSVCLSWILLAWNVCQTAVGQAGIGRGCVLCLVVLLAFFLNLSSKMVSSRGSSTPTMCWGSDLWPATLWRCSSGSFYCAPVEVQQQFLFGVWPISASFFRPFLQAVRCWWSMLGQ